MWWPPLLVPTEPGAPGNFNTTGAVITHHLHTAWPRTKPTCFFKPGHGAPDRRKEQRISSWKTKAAPLQWPCRLENGRPATRSPPGPHCDIHPNQPIGISEAFWTWRRRPTSPNCTVQNEFWWYVLTSVSTLLLWILETPLPLTHC